jgi:hypothetical protein
VLDERVDEVAIFTDGLQMLALNMEYENVHQPFFKDMYRVLRLADEPAKVDLLNGKLADYLNSNQINDRTDDDKTLFLASRFEGMIYRGLNNEIYTTAPRTGQGAEKSGI